MPTQISGTTGVSLVQDGIIDNADINSAANISGFKIASGSVGVAQLSAGAVQTSFGNTSGGINFRNKIINGNFDIWQRTTSTGTWISPVNNIYVADRWNARTNGTGGNGQQFRASFTSGQTEVPGEPVSYSRIQVTSAPIGQTNLTDEQLLANPSTQNNYFEQRIENVRTLAGKPAVLTFYARSFDANRTIRVFGLQYFNGSPSVTCFIQYINLTTSWQKFTINMNIPSIAGKTLGSGNYLSVAWNLPINTTYTFDIAQVQLEEGSVATPFEQRPFGLELLLCQRYFQKFPGGISIAGVAFTGSAMQFTTLLPVPMRISPAVDFSGLTTSQITAGTALLQDGGSVDRLFVQARASVNLGAFSATWDDVTLDAEL